ncbi:MAG: DNA polymerase III subunit alpha [Thermomicrobiales bacterium]
MHDFAHLHLHTEFSLLDGMGRVDDYMAKAKEFGMQHLAVTDHGVMYAAMDWYKAATKSGLHPIIGIEAYLAEGRAAERERKNYHLLLLAENEQGYRNLLKLASRASLEGFYYRPRVDLEMLQEHHEGVIATSACLGGPVANNFLHGKPDLARSLAGKLGEIFGPERFYIEVQDHGIREQVETNRELIPLARSLGLPLVATNDVHYTNVADAPAQDVLVCVQTNTTLSDPKRMKQQSDQMYFKSGREMWDVFGDLPEALTNTVRIAEMCSLDLSFKGYHLPAFDVPDGFTSDSYLEHLCRQGVIERYGHDQGTVGERLSYELSVIRAMGFTNYFLVVWDFVKFAKDNGILVGPGRGSAAGSIVTYSLGVTALDPLKYDLIFERFLNPARITMPDIDIDFADDWRAEVIAYVVQKYGDDRVAQIVTFGTLAAKASVRDVGRAMGVSMADADRVAKLIPVGPGVTIASAMTRVPELRALYDSEAHLRELIDAAKKVEGIARHASTHAAGVIISRDPLVQHVPLQRAGGKSEGDVTTQYPMGRLEEIGLLKMDFLGLSTLTILGKAVELARRKDPELTLDGLPLHDKTSYEALRRGETVGIFQLEGGMTTRMTIDVAPSCFEDLIALMALIRPGPMEMAPDFIARKHGQMEIAYMHPLMEPILRETYGIALYQEQVIRISNVVAKFTLAEGDGLRKAMGKKLPEEMAKYRGRFVEGCVGNGLPAGLAGEIFDMIERFAGYGFNKSHSAAYAVIAAQTAYMKAHYPVEFMAALLSTEIGTTEKIVLNLVECRRSGIPVLPPSINASVLEFSVEVDAEGREAVRYGLGAVKNVGFGAVESMLAARAAAPDQRFTDLEGFCRQVDWTAVNKRAVECLARVGALDEFGSRSDVVGRLDVAVAGGQQHQKALARGQMGLFAMQAPATAAVSSQGASAIVEVSRQQLLTWEKEYLGFYLSDHPLSAVLGTSMPAGLTTIVESTTRQPGAKARLIGMVAGVRRVSTRANKTMAIIDFEDLTGNIELVAFPEIYEQHADLWNVDQILEITAKIDKRGEQTQLVCETASREITLAVTVTGPERTLHLTLPGSHDVWDDIRLMQAVDEVLARHDGEDPVVIHLPSGGGTLALRSRKHRVECNDILAGELRALLSSERVWVEEAKLAS